ncbi:MAG: hypothetical protein KQJ78_19030 [Deltaproteobacteria bacterium]|nr:hypothetical protein [Deltaproteobacteria bacterium]
MEGIGPGYLQGNQDPEYPYLFGALNMVEHFRVDGLIHHPGVTTTLHDGLAAAAWHTLAGQADLATDLLQNSERYLLFLRWLHLAEYALLLFAAGAWVLWATGRLSLALLLQMGPLVSLITLWQDSFRVRPEAQLLLLAPLLGAYLAGYLLRPPEEAKGWRPAAALALLASMLVATKITSLPLLLIPIMVLITWRQRLVFCGLFAGFSALWLAPFWSRMVFFLRWSFKLAGHAGKYGSDPSVFNGDIFFSNLSALASSCSFYFLLVGLTALAGILAAASNREDRRLTRALLAVSAAQILAIFLVARSSPLARYLVPTLSLCGLNLILLWLWSERTQPSRARRLAMVAGVCVLWVGQIVHDGGESRRWMAEKQALAREHLTFEAAIAPRVRATPTIHAQYSSSPAAATCFGLAYNPRLHQEFLRVYPQPLFYYSPFDRPPIMVTTEKKRQTLRDFAAGRLGWQIHLPLRFLPKGLLLTALAESGGAEPEGLYRIDSLLDDPQAPAQVVNRANGGRAAPSAGPRPEGESGD